MKRLIAVGVLLCLCLSSCTAKKTPAPVSVPVQKDPDPVQYEIRVCIETGLADEVDKGIDRFAQKLNEVGRDSYQVEIFYSADPFAEMRAGRADFLYVSNAALATQDARYGVLTTPFFFRDYDQMMMTLNSAGFRSLTAESCTGMGVYGLGAIYKTSRFLLSNERYFSDPVDLEGMHVQLLEEDPLLERVLTGAFSMEVSRPEEFDLSHPFTEEGSAFDCTPEMLGQTELDPAEESYLGETYHYAEVEWFFADRSFWAQQSEYAQATVEEAVAFLMAEIERPRLELYRKAVRSQEKRGMEVTKLSVDEVRRRAKDWLYADEEFYNSVDWAFYDNVSAILR